MNTTCPFVFERSIVLLLKGAVQLTGGIFDYKNTFPLSISAEMAIYQISNFSISSSSSGDKMSHYTDDNKSNIGLECFWLSMRLLRSIPVDYLLAMEDKLGSGLLAFVR